MSASDLGSQSLRSVLLAGGGTAGHVSPLLAVADCLRRHHPEVDLTILGTDTGLESRLVPARGYALTTIPKVPMPRRVGPDLLRLPTSLRSAVSAADRALTRSAAQVVVGFGGYVSTPAYLAARRRGIPIVIHEQNAKPGLANRLGARMACHTCVTFPGTPLPNAVVTGMPLRREIATLDRDGSRPEALSHFGLKAGLPTVLVTGGSLGAQRINDAFAAASASLSAAGIQVLHLTGGGKEFAAQVPPGGAPYVVVPYVDRMDLAYAAADLVVARSGASTVCELSAVGLPAAYVPLPHGNGEQRLNAASVVEAGGAVIVDDAAMSAQWVESTLLPLMRDQARIGAMAAASATTGTRDGDEQVVRAVTDAAAGQGR